MNDNSYGNMQFHHDQVEGITYAVDIPFTREDLLELVHAFDSPIELMVGKAYVHPNDTYCKKTGREVSMQKLKPTKVKLTSLWTAEDKIFINLFTEDKLSLKFRVNKHSDKPHFLTVMDCN